MKQNLARKDLNLNRKTSLTSIPPQNRINVNNTSLERTSEKRYKITVTSPEIVLGNQQYQGIGGWQHPANEATLMFTKDLQK
jgi:hypothetical protein